MDEPILPLSFYIFVWWSLSWRTFPKSLNSLLVANCINHPPPHLVPENVDDDGKGDDGNDDDDYGDESSNDDGSMLAWNQFLIPPEAPPPLQGIGW